MRHIFALLSFFLLAACLSRSPDSAFYSLETIAPAQPLSQRKMTVAVNRAVVPSYLDKPQIVMRDSAGVELQISEYQRWGETLSSMLSRVMADDLGLLLPNAQIRPQNFMPQTYQYYLTLEVNRMDGTWNKQAVLDVWWTISNNYNKVYKRGRSSLSAPMGKSYEEYVQIQSKLLAEAAAQIAESLAKLP